MRRILATALMATVGVLPAPAIAQEDDERSTSGSLVQHVVTAADRSLGADAAVAVVRAYDRGYDLLQIIEALFDGLVAADGTIADDEGAPLAPFREPSNVIEENATSSVRLAAVSGAEGESVEAIALKALESGIQKTTKRLDKKYDLQARAEDAGASEESVMTMLALLALMRAGYSPEQIIIGLADGGVRLPSFERGLGIYDEDGKLVKPDGVDVAPEQDEAAAQVDAFVDDGVDTIAGISPLQGADTPFKDEFDVEIEIVMTSDAPSTITGKGSIGPPKKKSLRNFVVGHGEGKVGGEGSCSVSEGGIVGDADSHPYEVSGPLQLGFSGAVENERATIRIAVFDFHPKVTGDDSFCVGIVRDTAGAIATQTYGPVEVRLRRGEEATATSTFGDATVTTTVALN